MPLNSVSETKKVIKVKYSFSLKRKNAPYLGNENCILKPAGDSKENAKPSNVPGDDCKEIKPRKRPFKNTYLNTLNASKRLKSITGTPRPVGISCEPDLVIRGKPPASSAEMLNGHHQMDTQYNGSNGASKKTPIATLSNLGNTCFLNSVLYTLRYAPRFLHNLHHLVSDLASVEQKLGSIRLKSSSLGRSAAGLASSGTRSWSSKDLLSLGQNDSSTAKTKIQIATERLHETFTSLRAAETKCLNSNSADATPEPFAADAFLCALRDVNSTFEGNRQQDAHELLICILNNIRETCRALSARTSRLHIHENGDSNGIARPAIDGDGGKPVLGLRKSWKKRADARGAERRASPSDERAAPPSEPRPAPDFVADDFEGTMVMRTTCLECETVREHSQAMCDVCVPVADDGEASADEAEPFRAAATAAECLRDQNKYWCSVCLRYVEARRSVGYARLPRLLVLQLKRFSGGMQKITRHAPTPTTMACFCETCARRPADQPPKHSGGLQKNIPHAPTPTTMACFCETCARRPADQPPKHRYILWAVIMHLGQTLSGGHYVAYARDGTTGDFKCEREGAGDATTNNTSSSFMRTLFNRPRPQPTGCAAKDCCVPRQRTDSCWLACDDELVKPISNEEFEDLLSAEPKMRSAATPYLLFYVKSEVG